MNYGSRHFLQRNEYFSASRHIFIIMPNNALINENSSWIPSVPLIHCDVFHAKRCSNKCIFSIASLSALFPVTRIRFLLLTSNNMYVNAARTNHDTPNPINIVSNGLRVYVKTRQDQILFIQLQTHKCTRGHSKFTFYINTNRHIIYAIQHHKIINK